MQNVHPMLIHFPIALFLTAMIFDLVSFARRNESFENMASKLFILSAIAFIASAITGLLAENSVSHSEEAHHIMEDHKLFQLIATGISVFIALLIFFVKKRMQLLRLVLTLLGAGFMTYGSYLGGELVYRFGIGTNVQVIKPDSNRQNEQPIQEVKKDSTETEEHSDTHEHKH
ncbi:DUF2231 domain-containing protein [bacterium]|nr:MAG: DUF2231 domain-containing protein [bacterium]MBL7995216.1 DUF2231 domain-containing protein [bacterium]